jgi:aryl-alcohol dehydrogenase-like predicted oxidoreductase
MTAGPTSNRREVLLAMGAGLTAAGLGSGAQDIGGYPIPYRTLGHTGEKVSCIGMGGYHLGKKEVSEGDAIKLIHAGIDRGINFLDNSWDYNEGESEKRMGKALKDGNLRGKVFLMTKNDGRTAEEFNKQLDESLKRLQTDHLDLIQFHEIIRYEDPDRIFAEDGAAGAALAAKKAGKVRHIGFTGHKDPHIHLYMLEVADKHNFTFDTAQMPINVMDAHFRSFGKMVVPELVKRNVGVLGMKSLGDTIILKSNAVTAMECLHFSLSQPVSVQITGIDKPEILDQAIKAAQTYKQVSQEQMSAILARTAPHAANGRWELFKTSALFDSTASHPQWLGGESPHVKQVSPPMS